MEKKGIAASKGYAIGTVRIKIKKEVVVTERVIEDVEKELSKFRQAIVTSREQLTTIMEKTIKEVGEKEALIFDSHMMFLDDPDFSGAIEEEIKQNTICSEYATKKVLEQFLQIFSDMDDEYLRERAADIKDVADRIIKNITGGISNEIELEDGVVIVAEDLTPSDTAMLDKNKVKAFLTDIGGRTSHSAIMARTLEIPAIVGLKDITKQVKDGDTIIVDGINGIVTINPSEAEILVAKENIEKYNKEKEELKKLVSTDAVTKSGKRIEVSANIGTPEDINNVLLNGADGVGLFRTEFLFMDRDNAPTEEEQFEAYKKVLSAMSGKNVVVRTLDIGGDKVIPYLDLPKEENPFLGYRAIRISLAQKEIFRPQLRALLRASVYGKLHVMFPMIATIEEFLEAKEYLLKCKEELIKEGTPVSEDLKVGIMVEIPAAAIIADEFAKHVDFFSIGSNDLIQYTLAADRMSQKVSYLYNPLNPSILKLIKLTIDAAHENNIWCGMCGEMAGDPNNIPVLLELGLDEFSMSASSILEAKKTILEN